MLTHLKKIKYCIFKLGKIKIKYFDIFSQKKSLIFNVDCIRCLGKCIEFLIFEAIYIYKKLYFYITYLHEILFHI